MLIRLIVFFLAVGILSTVPGCAGAPSPSPDGKRPSCGVTSLYEIPPGPQDERGIDYERKLDAEEQQYRRQRSIQEQERAYQQWEQERARFAGGALLAATAKGDVMGSG
jgi:hypothetical protein